MPTIDRPRKGEPIAFEWGCAVADLLNQLLNDGPEVAAPLGKLDGVVYFADNYLLRSVLTTSAISARSGATMGTGTATFQSIGAGASNRVLAASGGYATVTIYSKLGNPVPSGVYGVVAWIDGQWELISADCSGNP